MIEVTYIDHCGSDLTTVNAARVSFGKKSELVEGEVKQDEHGEYLEMVLSDKDKRLIHYLAKHQHLSPFGHAFASFHVKAPIFVARQLVKHKFLRWNEISRRYVDVEPEFYVPEVWRGRSADKKQGSDGVVDLQYYDGDKYEHIKDHWDKLIGPLAGIKEWSEKYTPEYTMLDDIEYAYECVLDTYKGLLKVGVAPEQARMVLPQSTMTEWYWSGSLDAFAAMCKVRCAPDTQYETQIVAEQISEKMRELFPVSWGALIEHDWHN